MSLVTCSGVIVSCYQNLYVMHNNTYERFFKELLLNQEMKMRIDNELYRECVMYTYICINK